MLQLKIKSDLELEKLFAKNMHKLKQKICAGILPQKIAIAVSGGADSVALVFLMNDWAKKNNIELIILSVNHNLRKEAQEEIAYVEKLSHKLQLRFYSLNWENSLQVKSNIQEKAREARYKLMTDLCNKLDILILLTAHHQDDYLENFELREARKSSIFGLSYNNVNFFANIMIYRPLWNIEKIRLIKFLQKNNILWFEDISNFSEKYQRTFVRKKLLSITKEEKINLLQKLEKINQDISIIAKDFTYTLAKYVNIYPFGFAIIDKSHLLQLSYLLQMQLVNFVLMIISGQTKTPRARSTNLFLEKILTNNNYEMTLHNCFIGIFEEKIIITREIGRNKPDEITLSDFIKKNIRLDNRFSFVYNQNINIDNNYIKNLKITYLSQKDYSIIKEDKNFSAKFKITKDLLNEYLKFNDKNMIGNYAKIILFTIPVIKRLEKIVGIPHISYYDCEELAKMTFILSEAFIFSSSFKSRFTHFWGNLDNE